ncbi:MAG: transposase zinc-binding domain-containing protein [Acidobacteria bacterium]|nr:transposase zinc-binding domain-containing protein [Acidobacteriota bacterium]MCI0624822.1 transposase zinc-binding domain-containing protein [Acidobacteriota bacterium]MCI0718562.1 transposase zinc-binding domain-containing protein [Acidobacteriota bacterium]
MHDIEVCRTAVLGGHLQQCDSCDYQRPCYNSCLMGSRSLWGVRLERTCSQRPHAFLTLH